MSLHIHADWQEWPETRQIMVAFTQTRQVCRFVGGCVRDALLNRPVTDVDLATPLPPQEVMNLLKNAHIKAIPTGIEHGTVTAVIGQKHFEITTLRRDVETDGRHAVVAYTGNWREDAERRDFTMNALYADASGTVTDFFGGAAHARAGKVVFIGEATQRIREDALRILRFFRFHAHYGKGALDAAGLKACAKEAALLYGLSGERIQTEMFKLLRATDPSPVLAVMKSVGIITYADPERLAALVHKEQFAQQPGDALRRLAALLYTERDKAAILAVRWKLSTNDRLRLIALVTPDEKISSTWKEAEQKKTLRKYGAARFIDHVLLSWAAAVKPNDSAYLAMIEFARHWQPPVFPLSGNDLIVHGMQQGKALGDTMKRLEDAWEASGYTLTKSDLLAQLS